MGLERVFERATRRIRTGSVSASRIIGQLADAYGWDLRATESDAGGARFEFSSVDVVSPE